NGTLTISGTPGGLWDMQLYDTDGNRLGGSVATQGSGANAYSEGTFNIDTGPQPLILRLRERQSTNEITSYLALNTTLALPAGVSAPSTAVPLTDRRTMVISPRGDGSITDSVSAANSERYYAFKAPPLSPLTVSV